MRRQAILLGLALLAAVAIAPEGAMAQSFTGYGPAPRLALPGEKPAEPGAPADRGAGTRETEAPVVRRLSALHSGMRLAGEDASLSWPIYLTAEQAGGGGTFAVAYLSAISVAPEASSMTVRVNGTVLGRAPIRAPGAIKIVEFVLPANVLKPGYNAVQVDATQRHRVDCSLQATHELWTQIDPARTGFILSPKVALTPDAIRDLPAIPTDAGGATPITVVLGGRPDLPGLGRIMTAVQAVTLAGRFAQPVVRFGGAHPGQAGLILAVGTTAALAAIPNLEAAPGTGPRSVLLPGRDERPAVLVVTGETEADVAAAVAALRPDRTPLGSPAGLNALSVQDGFRIKGGEEVTLAQMGLKSRDFSGRLGRASAYLSLPHDFLAADYGKAVLRLRGGYAGGLAPGAQVMVDVNGRNVANVRLPRAGGDLFREVELHLPLSRWRPGTNLVEITAEVPTPADRVCDTSQPPESSERFLLLDSTSIQFPTLARVLKIPDLAATAGGGSAYALDKDRPRLVLPVPDTDTVSAAATLAARLAKSADRVLDFEIATTRQLAEEGPTIVMAPVKALDPSTISALGLSPDQVRTVWQARAEASTSGPDLDVYSLDSLRRNIPAACAAGAPRFSVVRPREPGRPGPGTSEADRELATRWEGLRKRTGLVEQFTDAATALKNRVVAAAAAMLGYARSRVAHAPVALPASASLVVGQGLSGPGLDQLLTVVTAPTAASLRAGVACLVDPMMWNRLDGRLAFLDTGSGEVATVPVDMLDLVATQGASIGNARLVAAGWLSLNPLAYVGLTLGAALCLGWSTTNLVRQIGRRDTR